MQIYKKMNEYYDYRYIFMNESSEIRHIFMNVLTYSCTSQRK